MKPGNLITKIVMWVFFAGIAVYFTLYAYHVLFKSYETATLYSYSAEDIADGNGYLFRSETVLEGGSELEEVVVGEGENVANGDTIAISYDDQEALDRGKKLSELEDLLNDLTYILGHAADGSDNATLNQNITNAITDIRSMAAGRDLSGLTEASNSLKSLMFRRDYTYNGSSALSDEIGAISSQIDELKQKNQASTQEVSATVSGIFSGVVDGYETVLTPEDVTGLSVSELRELTGQEVTANPSIGKIITDATWYCAVEMTKENAEKLYEGGTTTLRFNGMDRKINMEVKSISNPENGVVCVVLSSNRYLSEITMLRNQAVDIIYGTVTGYRVDKSAIYVDSNTGHAGVYRVYGSQVVWVDVDLLWEGEDYYLVQQSAQYDDEGNKIDLTDLEAAKQLRAGAEIVVSGTGLYDGKVLE